MMADSGDLTIRRVDSVAVTNRVVLTAVLVLAAVLRLWGPAFSSPVWHPDESDFVYLPFKFLGSDLSPTFFTYPSLLFYLIGLVFWGIYVLQYLLGPAWSLEEFSAYYYFWEADAPLLWARIVCIAFSVGTVAWVAALGRRLFGNRAGWTAGLLLAVCPFHVRQSALAAVDIPMTCFFVGATWAGVRLLERHSDRDYMLAGGLVGLAAATKYPGALAAAAIVAAHFLSGRSLWDRRIWLAGLASVLVFLMSSPYVMIDYSAFAHDFLFQVDHMQDGHLGRDLGVGWWYHWRISLRYGLGWVALTIVLAMLLRVIFRRHHGTLVVLCALLALFLIIGSGNLFFVRYALPLMALLAVVAAGSVQWIRSAYGQGLLVVLMISEPLYASLRTAQILGRNDTRVEARAWFEDHAAPGVTCCDIGGWSVGLPLATFESLMWRTVHFERSFGAAALENNLNFLEQHRPPKPFYWYAIQAGKPNGPADVGAFVSDKNCTYVVVHRHPLTQDFLDFSPEDTLSSMGTRLASWTAEGMADATPQFDPIDAYFVPIGDFGSLRQPGPNVEIWRLDRPLPKAEKQTTRGIFATAYAVAARKAVADGRLDEAHRFLDRSLELQPESPHAALQYGLLETSRGNHRAAIEHYERALSRTSNDAIAHYNLGVAYQQLGDRHQANAHWESAAEMDPGDADSRYNLGVDALLNDDPAKAVRLLRRVIELRPGLTAPHNYIAAAHLGMGQTEQAANHWQQAIDIDSTFADARYNLAHTLQYDLARHADAIPHWRWLVAHRPHDPATYIHLGNAQSQLGDNAMAQYWYAKVVETDPEHPQSEAIRKVLESLEQSGTD